MKLESEVNKRIATLSPAQRAALMRRLQDKGEVSARDRIPRRNPQQPVVLSFAQERLWFLAALEPESRAYNSGKAYHLKGPLNVVALQKSFEEILRRHEALRTTFASHDGSPVQVIAPHGPLKLPIIDLTIIPREQRAEEAMLWAEAEFRVPFDLTTGPLMRATLLRLDEQEHLLVFTVHHIVYDGWSADVLGRELSAFYDAISLGRAPDWPDLPIQYADCAAWQRQRLTGEQLELRLAFWRKQLSGAAVLDLLTDRPRPAHQTYRGARLSFALSSDLAAKLEKFNRKERVTPFMTLLSAFAVLLFRRSDQEDIIVGTPIANRPNVELEELIGFFVNSLVMRVDLSGAPSFRDLVSRVRRTALDAYQHQDLPFEKLVEDLNPERHMSRHPLFQVMFALQNAPRQALTLSGIEVSQKLLPASSTRFDLELHICAEGDGCSGWFVYSRDLFDAGTVEGMARQYVALLEGMLVQPERPVSLVPMMSDREREQILVEWNATSVDYPRDRCIHEFFEEQARRTPRAVAVECEGATLSYAELELRSNAVARQLRRTLSPGECVAACIERSPEMIVGLLGILKAGAAYVPMDPTHPQDRLAFIMADAGTRKLLTGRISRSPLEECVAEVIRLDREVSASAHDVPAVMPVSPDSLAYVMYTSGSTGQPKGVEVTHRSVVNLLNSLAETPGIAAADRLLALTTLSFDISVAEIFLPLSVGARIILAGDEAVADAFLLKQLIEESQPTIIQATPSRWRLLLEAGWRAESDMKIFCTGEALPRELGRQLTAMSRSVWNLYGPTETTVFSCIARVEERPVHIGRPIANTQIYLLDSHLNPVPVGVAGEIWIGGEGVASGYLNRPELTAERFIQSPFVSGQRLYRTGDLGRFLADGNIEFLGRRDHQVKIRGFRIELGEIDCLLRQHPNVAATVVVVREDNGQKQLVAYFVAAAADQPPAPSELREFLRQKLPNYMVPSAFVVLEKLPLTPNGKIDQKALPPPVPDHKEDDSFEPRNETERTVADVWSLVLNLDEIGAYDDFFELGGHSLLATRVVSRLRSIFGVDITPRVLFDNPTVAALAEFIDCIRSTAGEAPCAPAVPDREDIVI